MSKSSVDVSGELLVQIDEMVREGYYRSRSEAVNDAVELLIKRYKKSKLHAKDRRAAGLEPGGREPRGKDGPV